MAARRCGRLSLLAALCCSPQAFVASQPGLGRRPVRAREALGSARAEAGGRPRVSAPPGFRAPEPRPLTLTRLSDLPSALTGSLALLLRLGFGCFVLGWTAGPAAKDVPGKYRFPAGLLSFRDTSPILKKAPRPVEPLVLYEYEGSPFCRKVREAACLLDLTLELRPCPGARAGFAQELKARGGRMTVPYLADPNTGREMYESDDIIDYLLAQYGPPTGSYDPGSLWPLRGGFATFTSTLATLVRGLAGSKRWPTARADNEQMTPLELWGYEGSPFVRPVRERLCALCLPHRLVPCPRGSRNRDAMVQKTGRFQVPFLVDPNTGIEMFESPEILEYLDAVYTTGAVA